MRIAEQLIPRGQSREHSGDRGTYARRHRRADRNASPK